MKNFFIILLTLFFVNACGGYKTGVLEKESNGFIKFLGNQSNVSVEVGESIRFNLNPETELYKLTPGKYLVKIFRNESLIVERTIIIQPGNTIEMELP